MTRLNGRVIFFWSFSEVYTQLIVTEEISVKRCAIPEVYTQL